MTRRSINDRRSYGRRVEGGPGYGEWGEESDERWDVGTKRGTGSRREAERSVELVPFHGSLETIILIKLTTDPPHGYRGILRNDLPGTVETGGYRFNRR